MRALFFAATVFCAPIIAHAQTPGAESALGVRARIVEGESHHAGGPSLFSVETQVFRLMQSSEPMRPTFDVVMVGTARDGEEMWRDSKTLEWRPCRGTQTGEVCAFITPLIMPGLERYLCNITVQAASGPAFSLEWGHCEYRPRGTHLPDLSVTNVETTAAGGATVTVSNIGRGASSAFRVMAVALDAQGRTLNSRLMPASPGLNGAGTTSIDLGTMAAPLYACELFVALDPDGVVNEGRLQNNWVRVPFGLCDPGAPDPVPDLAVTDITWPVAPSSVSVPVTVGVMNVGGRPAQGLGGVLEGEVRLLAASGEVLLSLHVQHHGALGPGESAGLTVNAPLALFERACSISAVIAPQGADGERFTPNNYFQKPKSCIATSSEEE